MNYHVIYTLKLCAIVMLVVAFKGVNAGIRTAVITDEDTRHLLVNINTRVISPLFNNLSRSSQQLTDKAVQFCRSLDNESFKDLQQSWRQTANTWEHSASFKFGPTVDDNIDFTVYFLPIKKRVIKTLLQQAKITVKGVDDAGVGAQGLGSIEYLLFSRELNEKQLIETFKQNDNQCGYLIASSKLLNENISTISRQWKHYGAQFSIAGNNSLFFNEAAEAKELLVNKLYQASQKISLKSLRIPIQGKKDAEGILRTAPYKLEAWRSANSLSQIRAGITGIENILEQGKVYHWLQENGHGELVAEISATIDAFNSIDIPNDDLFVALQSTSESPNKLLIESEKLTKQIKQLAQALNAQLGFNDNDGD